MSLNCFTILATLKTRIYHLYSNIIFDVVIKRNLFIIHFMNVQKLARSIKKINRYKLNDYQVGVGRDTSSCMRPIQLSNTVISRFCRQKEMFELVTLRGTLGFHSPWKSIVANINLAVQCDVKVLYISSKQGGMRDSLAELLRSLTYEYN